MGVKGKKSCLLRQLTMSQYHPARPLTLTDVESQRIDQMTLWIANAVAWAIDRQPYVSQNMLNYTMARVTALVMKLNFDMFDGEHEIEHQLDLIVQEWLKIKDIKIDYEESVGTEPNT